ncbi:a6b13861-98b1-439e-a0e0-a118a99f4eb7 [Sclerotinia trifoliorum]|uniref:A6b13861-98b1-439e-a0e0-a118a99f4eb7 n=1 Tax=Sclerotinia trifoliorum TaxID=28548 RepID=A0A8H2ZMZ7_9HELO|nr:a6b13861-98b1-439e-a0e0-a118a99f4eb7 [Sclerotinia trifoliorum]
MSRHGAPSRVSEYDERETYYRGAAPPPAQVRVRERDHEESIDFSTRRGPERPRRRSLDFLRDDYARSEPGQMVVRERETETFNDRPLVRRPRSPSPPRFRERIVRSEVGRREPSPPSERVRTRIVEREKETQRSPSPPPQLRARVIETRQRFRERSPSPPAPSPVRIRERVIERERERERERSPSPPPPQVERIHTRIVERERENHPQPHLPHLPHRPRSFEHHPFTEKLLHIIATLIMVSKELPHQARPHLLVVLTPPHHQKPRRPKLTFIAPATAPKSILRKQRLLLANRQSHLPHEENIMMIPYYSNKSVISYVSETLA